MNVLAIFQAIDDNHKAAVVRKLIASSTPNFDFFYLVGLSMLMAALGLLADSASIVIGSMLLAPLLYPILGLALGLIMSDAQVITRSFTTLTKSFLLGLGLSAAVGFVAANLTQDAETLLTSELLLRTSPDIVHILVAVVAGLAVSFALAQPEWSETLPGVAISVALIPPLAAVGVGLGMFDFSVAFGALGLLGLNVFGIIAAAMVSFSMMNLYEKKDIATSTIKREEERIEKEQEAIQEVIDANGEQQKHD